MVTNETKKRAVVTGGAGFIGSHLVDALIAKGYDVDVIDNLSAGKKEHVNPDAILHVVDIRNLEEISPIIKGADYVFHFAALPRVQYSIENPIETNEVNVTGTLNVFSAAQKGGVSRVVYSASSSAYGDQETMPLHEEMSAEPLSPYGLQKYIGEQYARLFHVVYGLSTVSLRYFNVYGPRFDPEGAYALVIGKFLKQRTDGVPISITGDGEQTRDFTHVRDVVRANILAAESPSVGNGEVINIGAGRNVSINRIAQLIGGEIVYVPARLEPKHTLASNERALKLLGWKPEIQVEEGIAELLRESGF
ncbi:MAG: NAD-dependent epimerase/dehydratase [Parcubacteria group bacterium GW2011_GWA2_47_7]|nr:MAG: NAD-dependent epimerase/dehydratase [Parcubacteria group bacterium GW2011_GWA2_47_7]